MNLIITQIISYFYTSILAVVRLASRCCFNVYSKGERQLSAGIKSKNYWIKTRG